MSPELTTVLMLLSLFVLLAGFPWPWYRHRGGPVRVPDRRQCLSLHAPQRVINGTLSGIHPGRGSPVHIHGRHDGLLRCGRAVLSDTPAVDERAQGRARRGPPSPWP